MTSSQRAHKGKNYRKYNQSISTNLINIGVMLIIIIVTFCYNNNNNNNNNNKQLLSNKYCN